MQDTEQLVIFLCSIISDFDIVEEFVQPVSVIDTSSEADLETVVHWVRHEFGFLKVNFSDYRWCTGEKKGVVTHLERMEEGGIQNRIVKLHFINHHKALAFKTIVNYNLSFITKLWHSKQIAVRLHFIIHHATLYAQVSGIPEVMQVVVKATNFILCLDWIIGSTGTSLWFIVCMWYSLALTLTH